MPPWLTYPFAVAFGAVSGVFPQRRHRPIAARRIGGLSGLALRRVRRVDPGLRQRSDPELPPAAWTLPALWRGFTARYALIEAASAAAAAAVLAAFGPGWIALGFFAFLWLLLASRPSTSSSNPLITSRRAVVAWHCYWPSFLVGQPPGRSALGGSGRGRGMGFIHATRLDWKENSTQGGPRAGRLRLLVMEAHSPGLGRAAPDCFSLVAPGFDCSAALRLPSGVPRPANPRPARRRNRRPRTVGFRPRTPCPSDLSWPWEPSSGWFLGQLSGAGTTQLIQALS